jgi:outer membrane murein-binding lipoprotein Lpp
MHSKIVLAVAFATLALAGCSRKESRELKQGTGGVATEKAAK